MVRMMEMHIGQRANTKRQRAIQNCCGFSDYVPEDLFTYAELLKMNGNHEEGEEWMEKFHELNKEDGRGIRYHNDREAYKALKVDDGQFVIRNLIVIPNEDFGAVFYQNKVVFASSREE